MPSSHAATLRLTDVRMAGLPAPCARGSSRTRPPGSATRPHTNLSFPDGTVYVHTERARKDHTDLPLTLPYALPFNPFSQLLGAGGGGSLLAWRPAEVGDEPPVAEGGKDA